MYAPEEYFGSPEKIALMKRSAALWTLVGDCPRYAYFGRLVALSDPAADMVDILIALAQLQGAAVAYHVPKESVTSLFRQLEARGFSPDRHEFYRGGAAAYAASKAVLAEYSLPGDLVVSALRADTDAAIVAATAGLCQSCDIMPVPGSVMRGRTRGGINLIASDAHGHPVGSASSFVVYHPESPHANEVFWGMLATRADRRGEKIALVLGAMTLVHMWEREGARSFMTGIREDNEPSRALCSKLGLADSEWVFAHCLDSARLGSSSYTR